MPKRVRVRKHVLAIKLQQVQPHPEPRVGLEQYTIPANLAAEILFEACYGHDDIEQKSVADLGTGTGRLALGALILGAAYVVGIDLNLPSLTAAFKNGRLLEPRADWVLGDIRTLRGPVDTVLMNPPFGTKRAHSDLYFLETALSLGKVIYSIHKSSTHDYITHWLRDRVHNVEQVVQTSLEIPHQFPFHRKSRGYVEVDVFRIQRD